MLAIRVNFRNVVVAKIWFETKDCPLNKIQSKLHGHDCFVTLLDKARLTVQENFVKEKILLRNSYLIPPFSVSS